MDYKIQTTEKSITDFYQLILDCRNLFDIHINEIDKNYQLSSYIILLKSKDEGTEINGIHFFKSEITLFIQIDFEKLFEEYKKLDFPAKHVKMEYDLVNAEGRLNFIKHEWHNFIIYLKSFNQINDNYLEIAKLAHNLRGTFIGSIYNI
jgi:hypothetical protein